MVDGEVAVGEVSHPQILGRRQSAAIIVPFVSIQ
jgi:hypothetical protein